MSISEELKKKIVAQEISQVPAWVFWAKNIGFWLAFVCSALLGAKAVGIMLYSIFETDFELLQQVSKGVPLWISLIPFVWIALYIAFFAAALYAVKHTKKGYRFSIGVIAISNVLISVVLGSISFTTGMAETVEHFAEKALPLYRGVEMQRESLWSHPEEGRLMGVIIGQDDETVFILESRDRMIWDVDYAEAQSRPGVRIEKGVKVRLTGEQTGDSSFKATIITPWRLPKPGVLSPKPR